METSGLRSPHHPSGSRTTCIGGFGNFSLTSSTVQIKGEEEVKKRVYSRRVTTNRIG